MSKRLTWEDLNLRQFLQINDVLQDERVDDAEKTYHLMQIIFGEEVRDWMLDKYSEKVRELDFLGTEMPIKDAPKKEYKINGNVYVFNHNLGDITTAQYFDFSNLQRDGNGVDMYPKLLSCFLIPKGHKYGDGYDFEQVAADVDSIGVVDAFKIVRFFFQVLRKSYNITKGYSLLMAMRTSKDKARELLTLYNNMESSLSLLGSQNSAIRIFLR